MTKQPKSLAQRLADASIKIARANHYLVGFDPATTDGISFDDWSDACRILVDMELKAVERQAHPMHASMGTRADRKAQIEQFYDLALGVLGAACYRQHHTHLSR